MPIRIVRRRTEASMEVGMGDLLCPEIYCDICDLQISSANDGCYFHEFPVKNYVDIQFAHWRCQPKDTGWQHLQELPVMLSRNILDPKNNDEELRNIIERMNK